MIKFKPFHIDSNDTLSYDVIQNNLIEYISIKNNFFFSLSILNNGHELVRSRR